ncbi:XRE family transcriptional regulator [Parvibaculum sp.]|uniref:XRE family transcriptional regulator n=1 Tax=Parvibaculum sp. TaxID=2024848 RepID=UPI002C205721|nr:XRE family transcriptional regulator [Parvibaculum sp.]HUD51562.1 XRE family transcriptional regulator [Parvibaculum sp.]
MTGRRKFGDLVGKLPAERRERIRAKASALREEMALHELREALHVTQTSLATLLGVEQPAIAKLERRDDAHISKIRQVIEGLGGELRLVAHFPNGDVTITNFSQSTK